MAIVNNGSVEYEAGQQFQPFALMTDSGNATLFSIPAKPWSGRAGFDARIRPNGLATGGVVTPHATNNTVNVAALTAFMAAVTGATADGLITVGAGTLTATRGATTNICCITSLTVDSAGALAAVAGTAHTAFAEVRGALGGPPFIPVGSIEIGQVRLNSITPAPVTQAEIFQVVNVHQERFNFPIWSQDPANGRITFGAALPLIHTGNTPKRVYAQVSTPIFAEMPRSRAWVPAETTFSVSSTQNYDGPQGAATSSLGQASWESNLEDGTLDNILAVKNQTVWVRFKPDKARLPYQLTQGLLGIARTFAVGAHPVGKFTLSAENPTLEFAS